MKLGLTLIGGFIVPTLVAMAAIAGSDGQGDPMLLDAPHIVAMR